MATAATRAVGDAAHGNARRTGGGSARGREVLDRALAEVDADERVGPADRATGLRLRIEFTDIDLALNIAAGEDGHHNLALVVRRRAGWAPKLDLRMDSETRTATSRARRASRSRSRAARSCSGESRFALLYLPATRLIVEPYRRLVEDGYPHLVAS